MGYILTLSGVARIFLWGGGAKRGSEATSGGENFENLCVKMASLAH